MRSPELSEVRSPTWMSEVEAAIKSVALTESRVAYTSLRAEAATLAAAARRMLTALREPPKSCIVMIEGRHAGTEVFATIFPYKRGATPEFPGGMLKPRETPETAVCREAKEELGVTLISVSLIDRRYVLIPELGAVHDCFVFAGTIPPGSKLRPSKEGRVGWSRRQTILNDSIFRDNAPMLFRAFDHWKMSGPLVLPSEP